MKKILFPILILLAACTKDDSVNVNPTSVIEDNITTEINDFVSKSEASNVAGLFFTDLGKKTKGKGSEAKISVEQAGKAVKSVETIFYESGNAPAMYLINYNGGGFVIISATKTYYPVLAYSDSNSLSLENFDKINDGLTIWKEEAKLAIKESRDFSEERVSKMRGLWEAYETQTPTISKKVTASYTYDEYMRWYQRMNELYTLAPGYSFGPLSSARNYISQSEYDNLLTIANMYGSDPAITIFGYKSKPNQVVGPLIGTVWHQQSSYNNLVPNQYPAGCVAVAMAQMMKFHRVPAMYNWNNMPDTYGTYDTQTLIRDIGVAVDMDYKPDGSSANNNEARDGFSSMGYSVSKKDHNYQDVQNELLIRKRPVYMSGDRKNFIGLFSWKGHAWVCEGAKYIDQTVSYFVEYKIANGSYSSLGGPSYQSPITSSGSSYLYFYLNWGWGSNGGNGWFAFNDVNSQLGSYEYDRENLYVYPY